MRNQFQVPKKQWGKWSEVARKVFNDVYDTIRNNHEALWPPAAHKLKASTLQVMAWNTAWIAADAANVK